jgi:hypothetical protein
VDLRWEVLLPSCRVERQPFHHKSSHVPSPRLEEDAKRAKVELSKCLKLNRFRPLKTAKKLGHKAEYLIQIQPLIGK